MNHSQVASKMPPAAPLVDRDADSRFRPKLFDELWGIQSTRVLPMFEGKILLESTIDKEASLGLMPVDAVPSAQIRVYLGRVVDQTNGTMGAAVVLAILGKNSADALEPDPAKWHSVRSTLGTLDPLHAALASQSLAINNWHSTHAYCPGCGTPTVVEQGGWVRRCIGEDIQLFPRTDPAVIVAITNQEGHLLLGSQASWQPNRWSIFAGYVEPGESAEDGVRREMLEETGLKLTDIRYELSQAWPYPYSLMLGFTAKADGSQIAKPDGTEIVRLEWFSRERFVAERGELLLPPVGSISRAMIEAWLASEYVASGDGA